MTGQEKEREALECWSVSLAHAPGLSQVMATGDVSLIGAFVLETFRGTAFELAEQRGQIQRVREMALEVYSGDRDAAARFLTRRHAMLDGKTPLEMALSSDEGAEAVINLLGQVAYGGGA